MKVQPKIVKKYWGEEIWIHNDKEYCGKILRFFKKGNKILLEAANQAYEPLELNLDQVIFQGKLLAVWRKA